MKSQPEFNLNPEKTPPLEIPYSEFLHWITSNPHLHITDCKWTNRGTYQVKTIPKTWSDDTPQPHTPPANALPPPCHANTPERPMVAPHEPQKAKIAPSNTDQKQLLYTPMP